MIPCQIRLLADNKHCIPKLAQLWFNELGEKWVANASVQAAEKNFLSHVNYDDLPLTFVALHDGEPIGMVSLRENDGIRQDLMPWLGSLIVDPAYRSQGVGESLIEVTKAYASKKGFEKLYLFTLDPEIHKWYEKLGWKQISKDKFQQHPVVVMEIDIE